MKLKIALRLLGHKAPDLDTDALERWRSDLWEIHEKKIDSLPLNGDADLPSWGYSDDALAAKAPAKKGADITIYMLNVPLEDNYYFRRISKNIACVSLYEVAEVLRMHNIPLENLILRMLYSSTLIHGRKGYLPPISELESLAHHETKGCIFDMNGIKTDIVFSCNRPILCAACRLAASGEQVSNEILDIFEKEIRKIRKRLYYRVIDWVKKKPLIALALSSVFAVFLGVVGSLVASYIYEKINTPNKALATVFSAQG